MAFSLAVKSAMGLGVVGCVSVSAVGANYLLSNGGPSIPELVKSKNPEKRLLDDGASEEAWKASWLEYRKFNKDSEKDIWSIDGWRKGDISGGVIAPEAFKKACALKIMESSSIYDEVVSYCTRKTVLADLVGDNSGRVLLVKVDGGNTKEWKAVWAEYKKSDSTNASGKDAWRLSNWPTDSQKEEAPDVFMNQCKTNSESEGYDPNALLYQQLLKYCTVEVSE